MIAERYPELGSLAPEEQLELAAELAATAARADGIPELTDRSVKILESRLEYFLGNRETGISWDDLRGQRTEA